MDCLAQEMPGIVTITLSQLEGRELFTYLGTLIEQDGAEFKLEVLEAAQDRLRDANALALWLREYVVLDLPAEQASAVLEAVQAELGQDGPPQKAHEALAAVREKLCGCLSGSLVAET